MQPDDQTSSGQRWLAGDIYFIFTFVDRGALGQRQEEAEQERGVGHLLCRREGAHDPVVELHQLVDPPQQLEGGTNLLVGGLDVAWDGKLVSLPYSSTIRY